MNIVEERCKKALDDMKECSRNKCATISPSITNDRPKCSTKNLCRMSSELE